MAEARRIKHHIHETNALSYGHLGTATYDDVHHDWAFLRQRQRSEESDVDEEDGLRDASPYFQLVDEDSWESAVLFSGRDNVANCHATDTRNQHTTNFRGLQNLLLDKVPEAAVVGLDSLLSAHPSEFLQRQPLSSALALGHARFQPDAGMHDSLASTTIVAAPAGPNRESLRLLGFVARQVSLDMDCTVQLSSSLPFVGSKEVGHWFDTAESILQVSSAIQTKGRQFLVVKPSGTTILRPKIADARIQSWIRERPTAVSPSAKRRIDPCPVVTIPMSRTGGSPHVHAALNPRCDDMVTIIDASGQWSIWKVSHRNARSTGSLYQAHLQSSNNFRIVQDRTSTMMSAPGDDWRRIIWFAGPEEGMDRVLICDRRIAVAFDKSGQLLGSVDMRLGPPSDRNVILDIKNSDRRREHLFVLTTSRMMVFTSSKGASEEKKGFEPLDLVCSWNHFRDRADLSLRMSVLELSKGVYNQH